MSLFSELPDDLPVPIDDGACDHLTGMKIPDLSLTSTKGGEINLSSLCRLTVIYIYPMTGQPDTPLPEGWDQIPGARGCTPQSCSFRDHHEELKQLGAEVYGLSTQSTANQQEAVERLHLPFALLSDEGLKLVDKLSLPVMQVKGKTLTKRTTLVCDNGVIKKVFYPVFPPDQNANEVINYLKHKQGFIDD